MLGSGNPTPFVRSYFTVPAGKLTFSDFQYCNDPGSGGVCINGLPLGAAAAGSVYDSIKPRIRTFPAVEAGWATPTASRKISTFHPGLDSFCIVPSPSRA